MFSWSLMAPLVLQSIGAFVWLALHLRARGGQVKTAAVDVADFVTAAGLTLMLLALSITSLVLMQKTPPGALKALSPTQILQFPIILVLLGGGIAGFLRIRQVSLADFFGWKRLPLWKVAGWGVALLVLAWPGIIAITAVIRDFLPKAATDEQVLVALFRSEVQQGHYGVVAVIVGAAGLLAPLGEEFLFRGYFYPVWKRYFGAAASALATAALFAFIHLNAASFAGLFVLALCLTAAYELTGSLLVPMAMHAAFNTMNLLVLVAQASKGIS